ncbi:MAG: carboxymuconolactone decarboxylase family protein [Phycisphaerales bacterium]
MTWIETIEPNNAEGRLRALYARVSNPDGTVDRVMQIHSLSPDSLHGHFEVYVAAMHRASPLSRAERELVGAFVSQLNGCEYCLQHHAAGLRRLLPAERASVADALADGRDPRARPSVVSEREAAMLAYAERLTRSPGEAALSWVEDLRVAGLTDREILDLACVVGYFCYANRVVLGLGVRLEDEGVGQHPTLPD